MKLRLLPRQEDAYFGLFEAAADNVVVAAKALLDLLSRIAEFPHCRSSKFPTSPGTPMMG